MAPPAGSRLGCQTGDPLFRVALQQTLTAWVAPAGECVVQLSCAERCSGFSLLAYDSMWYAVLVRCVVRCKEGFG